MFSLSEGLSGDVLFFLGSGRQIQDFLGFRLLECKALYGQVSGEGEAAPGLSLGM